MMIMMVMMTACMRRYLSNTQLSGTLPPSVGNLTALTDMYLYSTQLSGTLPPSVGNLTALTEMDLHLSLIHI